MEEFGNVDSKVGMFCFGCRKWQVLAQCPAQSECCLHVDPVWYLKCGKDIHLSAGL